MARRRVSVELILEAAQYLRESKQVALVTVAASDAIDELGDQADGTSRDLAEMAANTDLAKRQVDDLGDEARGSAADLKLLEARIEASKLKVRQLGLEFARTGDAVAGADLGKERSLLGQLERLHKELEDLNSPSVSVPIANVTRGGGGLDIGGAFSGMGRGGMIGGIVALVAMAAPAIGAMVGGAVLGSVATGGVVGGVIAATKDPRVKQAWTDMLGRFSAEDFGGDAMAQPVIDSLGRLGTAIKELGLDDALSQGGPALEELTDGVIRFAQGVMPGFVDVMADSGTTAAVVGDGLATVGESLGDMIQTINSSEGALVGLEALFDGLGWTLRTLGDVVKFLGDGFKFAATASATMSGAMEDVVGWVPGVGNLMRWVNDITEDYAGTNDKLSKKIVLMGSATALASQKLDPFSAYLKEAANNADALNVQLDELFAGALAVDEATMKYEESVDELTAAIQANGRSIDARTEQGRAVRGAILDEIQAAMALREANIKAGMSTADANKIYQDQINKLEAAAIKAGINKQALLELTGDYHVSVIYTISTRGSVPKYVGAGYSEPAQDAMGAGRRASGGSLMPGVPYKFGEHGPEYGMFDAPGRMYSHSQSMAMAQAWQPAASSGGGNRTVTIIVQDTSGRTLRKQLINDAKARNQPDAVVRAAYP